MAVPLTDLASGIVFMLEWIKIGKLGIMNQSTFSAIFFYMDMKSGTCKLPLLLQFIWGNDCMVTLASQVFGLKLIIYQPGN